MSAIESNRKFYDEYVAGLIHTVGYKLSIAYNALVDSRERSYYTDRLRERRGVMNLPKKSLPGDNFTPMRALFVYRGYVLDYDAGNSLYFNF